VGLGGDDGNEEFILVGGLGSLFLVEVFKFGFRIEEPGN